MKSQRLPDTEFAIMEIIWDLPAPVTIGQVREKLTARTQKEYKMQSLVTLFGRLAERGFLRADEESAAASICSARSSRARNICKWRRNRSWRAITEAACLR